MEESLFGFSVNGAVQPDENKSRNKLKARAAAAAGGAQLFFFLLQIVRPATGTTSYFFLDHCCRAPCLGARTHGYSSAAAAAPPAAAPQASAQTSGTVLQFGLTSIPVPLAVACQCY